MNMLQIVLAAVGYFLLSAAAGAMYPPSEEQKRGWYGFLYRFAQTIAANAHRLAEAKFGSIVGDSPSFNASNSVSSASSTVLTERHVDVAVSSASQ